MESLTQIDGNDLTRIPPNNEQEASKNTSNLLINNEYDPIPIEASSFFGEQLVFDGTVGNGITTKEVPFQVKVQGRLRKNLNSSTSLHGSDLDIQLIDPTCQTGIAQMGHAIYSIRKMQPSLEEAIRSANPGLNNIVQITALVSSVLPRKGIGTSCLQVGETVLNNALKQALASGIYPADTSFVRIVLDQASLDGWTQDRIQKGPQQYSKFLEIDGKPSFYRVLEVPISEPGERATFQLTTSIKKRELRDRIIEITEKPKIDESLLPNFDSQTGESLHDMPITQLFNYLEELQAN